MSNTLDTSTYSKRRRRFVFFTREIRGTVGKKLWEGIYEEAIKHKIDMLCYMGGKLGEDHGSIIYNLVNKEMIDGCISWASSDKADNSSFFNQYKDFPFVTLTLPIPGFPVVMADSYQGMKEAVEHLIDTHGFKKIAYVRGPEAHIYANQRYQAYIDVMKSRNLLNDILITPPLTWNITDGKKCISIFLDERGLKPGIDFEAIVFVSDNLALGAFNELNERKIRIPEQVALIGYNASQAANTTTPPITSVSMPFKEQGAEGVNTLLKLIAKEAVPKEIVLPSKLVIAQSCGCQSPKVANAAVNIYGRDCVDNEEESGPRWTFFRKKKKKDEEETIEELENKVLEEIKKFLNDFGFYDSLFIDTAKLLLHTFIIELEKRNQGEFLAVLGQVLRKLINNKIDCDFLQDVISIFRRNMIVPIDKKGCLYVAEDIWTQSRIQISEASLRVKEQDALKKMNLEHQLRDISSKIITTYDIEGLMNTLTANLAPLKIPGCYVCLFEHPENIKSLNDTPENAKLIMAYRNNNRVSLDKNSDIFPAKDLLPERFLNFPEQTTHIVQSLHFNEIQIGYIIFQVGPEVAYIYYTLSTILSSALYGALLYQKTEHINHLMKNTLDDVESETEIISVNSSEISNSVNNISTSMEQVAASIQEISKNIGIVMDNVKHADTVTKTTSTKIDDLKMKSNQIGDISGIINDIAEQTNMLALNAAIEAARAGEKGRGFSIVAKEVKELARRTVDSTEEISEKIKSIQTQTSESVDFIKQVASAIKNVMDLASTITYAITEQSTATSEVSNLLIKAAEGSKDISRAITKLSEIASLKIDSDLET